MTVDAALRTAPLSMTMELTMPDQRAKGPLSIRFADKAMYVGGGALDIRKLGRSAKLDPGKLNGKSWLRIEPAAWGLISVDNRSYGILPHQVEGSPIVQSTLLTGAKNAKKIGRRDDSRRPHHALPRNRHLRRIAGRPGCCHRQDQPGTPDPQPRPVHRAGARQEPHHGSVDRRRRAHQAVPHAGRTYKMPDNAGEEPTVGDPLDMTVAFLRINEPVTVTPPSAGDTTDPGALLDAQTG
ncbi:hypothetical protein ABZ960_02110 [Streptomyces pseudovenezuelae]|uniref:hypothetical protein n=1 Tax=Streptomyces pseudovenezuelae TaxID=67350 RepID=UPI0034A49E8E